MTKLKCATNILGNSEERYFSNGFKSFDFNFYNIKNTEHEIDGFVEVKNNASPNSNFIKKRQLHLGTIEYLAMGCTICEHALRMLFNFNSEQLSKSWISYSKMKINKSVEFKNSESLKVESLRVSFNCLKTKTIISGISINKFKSYFHIKIDDVLIVMEVDHPEVINERKPPQYLDSVNVNSIYNYGYKQRSFDIKDIQLSLDKMSCYANIKLHNSYIHKNGIGSCYDSVIMPDIISVTGQLTQILLYRLENLKREQANNLWLREMEINYPNPYCANTYENNIEFSDYRTISRKSSIWRAIDLEARIGNIISKFKVAHLLPIS